MTAPPTSFPRLSFFPPDKRPRRKHATVVLGPRDNKSGDDHLPLLGSPLLVGGGKRWAVITNAQGPFHGNVCKEEGGAAETEAAATTFFRRVRKVGTREALLLALGTAAFWGWAMRYRLTFTSFRWVICFRLLIVTALLAAAVIIVALLRRREAQEEKGRNGLRSRGHLIPSFVDSDLNPEEFVCELERRPDLRFDGFSILLGVGNDAYFVSNRPAILQSGSGVKSKNGIYKMKLDRGRIIGLSNAYLDDPRGRVKKGKILFAPIIHRLGCGEGRGQCSPKKLTSKER